MRVRVAAALVLALVLAPGLAGCASLPTTGPVTAGLPARADERGGFRVLPAGPGRDAGPGAVVAGFLRAGVGADDDFTAARSHLVAGLRASWRPGARVVVHPVDSRTVTLAQAGVPLAPDADVDPARGPVDVEVTAPVHAVVDGHGVHAAAAPGTVERLSLRVVPEGGQWRIDSVPDQLLIDTSDFAIAWEPRTLYFPDRWGQQLVPEVRWFAERGSTPTTAAAELLRGPSAWLAPATRRDHARGVSLASDTVPVQDGTAQVDLSASVLDADALTRTLLVRQMQATLLALPAVESVVVTAGGGAVSSTGARVPPHAQPRVELAPALLVDGAPHRWGGGAPMPVAGLGPPPGALAPPPLEALALEDGSLVGLVAGGGALLRWEPPQAPADPAAPAPPAPVLAATALSAPGGALTPPSLDPRGWAWSTARACDGTVTAVSRDGVVAVVGAAWLAGRTVLSLRASREGARVAVVSAAAGGGDPRVDVAGLERADDGSPRSLTVPDAPPTPWLGAVVAAAWVDETTVAVVGTEVGADAAQVFLLTGGEVTGLGAPGTVPGTVVPAPGGAPGAPSELVGLAAGNTARSLLLSSADGRVFQRAGARWVPVDALAGARAPAFAG